jgi:heat shock protein HslJ
MLAGAVVAQPVFMARKKFPFDAQWIAVSLNDKPFPGERADRPTLTLDETLRVRGFGACNTYSATAYPLQQQAFAVGPIALTQRECPKATMDVEKAFLLALRTAQQWDTEPGKLVIAGQNGKLVFERTFDIRTCRPLADRVQDVGADFSCIPASPVGSSVNLTSWKASRVERWPIEISVVCGNCCFSMV